MLFPPRGSRAVPFSRSPLDEVALQRMRKKKRTQFGNEPTTRARTSTCTPTWSTTRSKLELHTASPHYSTQELTER
ncbi:hypothetical protein MTO96_038578 [Rhipicephalus appendiculatus]